MRDGARGLKEEVGLEWEGLWGWFGSGATSSNHVLQVT